MASPTGAQLAKQLCEKFPDSSSRQLSRILYKENIERFSSENAALLQIRRARGNQGKANRRLAKVNQPKRRPECPPSSAEEWKPFELDCPSRVLSLSDLHIPYHDKRAIETAVKFAKKRHRPDVLVLNGDICDFYNVSRWEKDPKQRDLKGELETTKEMLAWLRSQFKDARIVYKLGNHEERWDKFVWNKAPEIWNLDAVQLHNILDFENYGIERVDDEPIMAGKLPILHGHELPKGLASPVNQARGMFLRALHTMLCGHGHRTSTHCEPDFLGREITTWSQGMLCSRNPRYCRINKWNLGFAAVDVSADKQFDLFNYRLSEDYVVRAA